MNPLRQAREPSEEFVSWNTCHAQDYLLTELQVNSFSERNGDGGEPPIKSEV